MSTRSRFLTPSPSSPGRELVAFFPRLSLGVEMETMDLGRWPALRSLSPLPTPSPTTPRTPMQRGMAETMEPVTPRKGQPLMWRPSSTRSLLPSQRSSDSADELIPSAAASTTSTAALPRSRPNLNRSRRPSIIATEAPAPKRKPVCECPFGLRLHDMFEEAQRNTDLPADFQQRFRDLIASLPVEHF